MDCSHFYPFTSYLNKCEDDKMTKSIKKFFATLIISAVVLANVFYVPAYAANTNNQGEIETWRNNSFDDLTESEKEKVVRELEDLGLSDKEIDAVIMMDSKTKKVMEEPVRANIGDTKTKTITISKSTLSNVGSAGMVLLLVSRGVPAAAAAIVAPVIAGLIADNVAFTSITITIHYVYGYTNDGVLGWNYSTVNWRINY